MDAKFSDKFNYIHGFDPGGITGYVLYKRDTHEIIGHEALHTYKEISKVLKGIDNRTDMVIFEKPVGKLTTQDQIEMVKFCGFIEGYCDSHDIYNIPQVPMGRVGYRKMAIDYFKKHVQGYVIHNIDAFAHILKYLSNEERKILIEKL